METYDIKQINNMFLENPTALIKKGEGEFHAQLNALTQELFERHKEIKVVLLTGPSASGKTTTANMLCQNLMQKGVECDVISLDNFYKNHSDIPVDEYGNRDLESIEAIDVELVNTCFEQLIRYGEADFPIFDFLTSQRSQEYHHVLSGEGELVIVEGIHAMNPAIRSVGNEASYYKVYISPRRPFMLGDEEILSPSGLRLIRRMLRDHQRRGSSVGHTLSMWGNVRASEKKHIFPYLGSEDFFVETTHLYEPMLYHELLSPILKQVKKGDQWYEKVRSIKMSLSFFERMHTDMLPKDTLMKEFMDL